MFKGKKSLYFLLPINLLVWGYIGLKIYNTLNEEEDILPFEKSVSISKLKKDDSVSYQLALNYPDPFLKQETHYKASNNPKPQPVKTPTVSVQKPVALPPKTIDLKYLGLVENKTSGASTGLISINGKSYLVKKGEVVEGVLVKSITSERLEAKIGKEVVSVKK